MHGSALLRGVAWPGLSLSRSIAVFCSPNRVLGASLFPVCDGCFVQANNRLLDRLTRCWGWEEWVAVGALNALARGCSCPASSSRSQKEVGSQAAILLGCLLEQPRLECDLSYLPSFEGQSDPPNQTAPLLRLCDEVATWLLRLFWLCPLHFFPKDNCWPPSSPSSCSEGVGDLGVMKEARPQLLCGWSQWQRHLAEQMQQTGQQKGPSCGRLWAQGAQSVPSSPLGSSPCTTSP